MSEVTPASITDKQWSRWGATDPYRGVLGVGSDAMSDGAVKAKFFASGDTDVALALDAIERRVPGFVARGGDVLDFGCGVGRLMAAFARRGFRVIGVDVSPDIIKVARQNLSEFAGRTGFVALGDIADGTFYDVVHSHIVIQHIRPVQGMPIVAKLMDLVRPGGFLAIQFTLGSNDSRRNAANWLRYRLPPLQYLYNVLRGRPVAEPVMELNTYDIHAMLKLCAKKGIGDITIFPHGGDTYRGVMIVGQKTKVAA